MTTKRLVMGLYGVALGVTALVGCGDDGAGDDDGAATAGGGGQAEAATTGASATTSSSIGATTSSSSGTTTSSTSGTGGEAGTGGAGTGGSGEGGDGGAAVEGVTLAAVDSPTGLAVDDDFVWFGSRGHEPDFGDGYVAKVPRRGGDVVRIAEGQARPLNVVVSDDLVVWNRRDVGTEGPTGSIVACAKVGDAAPFVLATGIPGPNNPVFVGDAIWFGAADGTIRSARLDGSEGEGSGTVIATLGFPADVAAMGDEVFWADAGTDLVGPAIVRRRVGDGDQATLSTGITAPSFRLGLGASFVFVGSRDAGTFHRVARDGSGSDLLAQGIVGSPHEVVVDEARGRVYFTSGSLGAVLSVSSWELPTLPEIVVRDQGFTSYLTADDDHLYWSAGALDADGGSIRTTSK